MKIKQQSTYVGEDWWRWSVELEGSVEELNQVHHVVYELHPTFPQPVRRVMDRSTNFRLDSEGWGEFTILARVIKSSGEIQLRHELELLYPDGRRSEN